MTETTPFKLKHTVNITIMDKRFSIQDLTNFYLELCNNTQFTIICHNFPHKPLHSESNVRNKWGGKANVRKIKFRLKCSTFISVVQIMKSLNRKNQCNNNNKN